MVRTVVLVFVAVAGMSLSASAKIKLPYCFDCEYLIKVADLPDSTQFYSEENKTFVDIGYLYKQAWAIWIPIWNYDGRYVLMSSDPELFYEIDEVDLKKYEQKYGLDLPANLVLFWNKINDKLLLLTIIVLSVWGYLPKKKTVVNKEEFFDTK